MKYKGFLYLVSYMLPFSFMLDSFQLLSIMRGEIYNTFMLLSFRTWCRYIHMYNITKKNLGLIHVYFLYTVFRAIYRALINKVTCLLNYLKKIGVGDI